jgi:hypothetical protein
VIDRLLAVVLMFLVVATMQACSSTNAGSGTGGFSGAGLGGNIGDGATTDSARDALLDAAPTGTPFNCGDGALTCAIGETYCRNIAGQRTPDGGQDPSRAECASFKTNWSPLDCSCIFANPGNIYCFLCTQMPSGAVVTQCGPV